MNHTLKKLFAVMLCVTASMAAQTIPHLVSYQGRLTDSENQPLEDGAYTLIINLYTQETGGSAIWSETHQVSTMDGYFNILLGAITPLDSLPNDGECYLGLSLQGEEEMVPLQKLVSAPFAYRAEEIPDNSVTTRKLVASAATNVTALSKWDEVTTQSSEWQTVPDMSVTHSCEGGPIMVYFSMGGIITDYDPLPELESRISQVQFRLKRQVLGQETTLATTSATAEMDAEGTITIAFYDGFEDGGTVPYGDVSYWIEWRWYRSDGDYSNGMLKQRGSSIPMFAQGYRSFSVVEHKR